MKRFILLATLLVTAACTHQSDDITLSICPNTVHDSQQDNLGNVTRIRSEATARYGSLTLPRQTANGNPVTMDYMVHENAVAGPKAIIVLIAGGQMNANIIPDGIGGVGSASGNFLVRSAHLFKRTHLFRVITIDRPSDYTDDLPAGETRGSAYDVYRTSARHAVDLSWVINAENPENLPVFIAGTSRGAVSAVAQYMLAAGIALSSPVTSGSNGRPVREDSIYPQVRPSRVPIPVHVLWHLSDSCRVSLAADSRNLIADFADSAGDGLAGGFVDPLSPNECGAFSYHGFLGIESCAVDTTVAWMDNVIAGLPAARPLAASVLGMNTNADVVLDIDLTGVATPGGGGTLSYTLAHDVSSLGGGLSLTGNVVSYTPPVGLSGTTDALTYVVSETGGGSSHHVVTVAIN